MDLTVDVDPGVFEDPLDKIVLASLSRPGKGLMNRFSILEKRQKCLQGLKMPVLTSILHTGSAKLTQLMHLRRLQR